VTVTRSVVLGCGSYLPSHILTNSDLAQKVDTTDQWNHRPVDRPAHRNP
jgi:3-oxoacyl-[acyl-carrier-protein] synthase-3